MVADGLGQLRIAARALPVDVVEVLAPCCLDLRAVERALDLDRVQPGEPLARARADLAARELGRSVQQVQLHARQVGCGVEAALLLQPLLAFQRDQPASIVFELEADLEALVRQRPERWPIELRARFPLVETIPLPEPVPDLAGATFLVTGSGRRLREIIDEPAASIGCVVVDPAGVTAQLHMAYGRRFQRVTSEFNSHLAVHADQIRASGTNFHAIIHAQPPHLTFLSHVPRYQDQAYLNHHVLRWQPETILNFPQGLGVLPFLLPGSAQLTVETMLALRDHSMVIWSQHGVIARSDASLLHALDLLEYAETAAHYVFLNLTAGGRSEGLNPDHVREVAKSWRIDQSMF